MGVSVGPGATTLQVIDRSTSSIAQLRESPLSADLVAAYWLLPAAPVMVRVPMSTARAPCSSLGTMALSNTVGAWKWTASIPARSRASSSPRAPVCMKQEACTNAYGVSTS